MDESNGVGEDQSANISTYNFGSTDASDLTPASYPITAGTNSFEKWIRLHWTSGAANQIDNLQAWKVSGNYVTGEVIKTNLTTTGYSAASYATPTSNTSSEATIDMPTADPTQANLGIGGNLTGSLSTFGYSDYWVMQLQTTGSTPAGDVNQKSIRIQYDEQ